MISAHDSPRFGAPFGFPLTPLGHGFKFSGRPGCFLPLLFRVLAVAFFFTLLFYTHRQQRLDDQADAACNLQRAEQQPGESGDDDAGGERDDEQDGHGRFRRESHSPHFLRRLIETGAIACRYLSATCFETGQDGASGIYTAGYTIGVSLGAYSWALLLRVGPE